MPLRATVSQYWLTFQRDLFPWLAEELGPLSERHKRLVQVLEIVRVEDWLPSPCVGGRGRPQQQRAALARALLAKAVFDVPTTRALVERLGHDPQLRRLGAGRGAAQRGDLLAVVRRIRGQRVARAVARGLGQAELAGPLGGARLAGLDGHRSARAGGP